MDKSADKSSGIPGLDEVLTQGLPLNRVTLVQGPPGSGRTTFALQFLAEGARQGGRGLFITLTETSADIEGFAASHGIGLDSVSIIELFPAGHLQVPQSFFHPGEVEIADISKRIIADMERLRPTRLALDSLAELRMATPDHMLFYLQITAIKHVARGLGVTTVLIGPAESDPHLQTIAHTVIELDVARIYGSERRSLRVLKMRDLEYVAGNHDYGLTRTGMRVYPRSIYQGNGHPLPEAAVISSGIPEFDAMLGGGIQSGTTTIMVGTTGTGKSAMAVQYAAAAAGRGERSKIYFFDERVRTAIMRAQGLGADIRDAVRDGLIHMEELNPMELSPGEFADKVRRGVETDGARIVLIDSLSGYLSALPDEHALMLQMHDLCSYLNRREIVTLLTVAQPGVLGASTGAPLNVDLSFLADTLVLFRSFEAEGVVRKAVLIVKKRYGAHENTIRELIFEADRIRIGTVLRDFQGLLTGTPHLAAKAGRRHPAAE